MTFRSTNIYRISAATTILLICFAAMIFFVILINADSPPPSDQKITPQPNALDLDQEAPIIFWQSYAASPTHGIHKWANSDDKYQIEKLKDINDTFRTGYAFIYNGAIVFEDLASGDQYQYEGGDTYTQLKNQIEKPIFRHKKLSFSFNNKDSTVMACTPSSEACSKIAIKKGTFPYVYAEHNDSVIVISNFGDALIFKEGAWCRMEMVEDVYSCNKDDIPQILEPRKVQFYSSVRYQGKTLLGEWPTGRLYEFDGDTIKPSATYTPPSISVVSDQRLGYEAQSMAVYCGDLFVGYWPKGEVYKYDHKNKNWSLFTRLFTNYENEGFIPHFEREPDDKDQSFFGQRVTALVPYKDSLYATTSNLRSWHRNISVSPLSKIKIDEYGSIYRIYKPNCESIYSTPDQGSP